jgi:hypothetical protein
VFGSYCDLLYVICIKLIVQVVVNRITQKQKYIMMWSISGHLNLSEIMQVLNSLGVGKKLISLDWDTIHPKWTPLGYGTDQIHNSPLDNM